ncbi:hypothetical protein PEBR_15545 [Penicillium brasilianum]|uniref:Uncharacterized protein n=1 Tax=Penicillium brasilianum TaxID=104259 RepID=A0A1S9RPW2_PENBI|nr:hypothetical protein PEBR_15545 [Penicillium brasilianum]
MSDLSSPDASPTPSSSTAAAPSECKEPDRWWRWGSESPKKSICSDHSESFILTQKRNRKQRRRFPELELYTGETDRDARKRMRLPYPDNDISKEKAFSGLKSEILGTSSPRGESFKTSDEMSERMTRLKRGKDLPAVPFGTGDAVVSGAKTEREIQFLKREIDLLGLKHERITLSMEQDMIYLQEENFALCRKLDWYKTQHEAKANGSCTSDDVEGLHAELERRNREIEEKIRQNSSLEEQLNTAEGLSAALRDSQDGQNLSTIFSRDLAQLETATSQAALLLVQCLSSEQISAAKRATRKSPELDAMIRSSLGEMDILTSHPRLAFSALLFGFTRERVFYSDCWTAFQLEGYMLRGYQAVIHRTTPRGTLESLHRAAFELMLEENHPFRDCWVESHVEEVQGELLRLLSPLIESSKLELYDMDIRTALKQLFTRAFHFRARCVPPRGTHYELIQVKAGDMFDPRYMEAQRPDGTIQSIPSGKAYRVKVCVHGCLVSHTFEEPFDGKSCSKISEPFMSLYDESMGKKLGGVLRSRKAIVILEDDTHP